MKKEVCDLFPTLVMRYENALDQKRLDDIFDFIKKKESVNHHPTLNSGQGILTSHLLKTNILKEIDESVPSCFGILEKINTLCLDYTQTFGCSNLEVVQSWFTIQNENSILKQHMHPGSIISGAIYIRTDEKSSNIYFDNPNKLIPSLTFNQIRNQTKYTYDYVEFQAKQGDILIFPSWLSHGSLWTENQTKYRTIISFNTMYFDLEKK